MRRGVPGGLRMPPAEAHAPGLLPREFADAPNTYPRPRAPCSTCGGELVYCWGDERGPYLRHLRNATGCTGGGEGDLHKWAKEDLADYLRNKTMLHFVSRCTSCKANMYLPSVPVGERIVETEYQLPSGGRADIAVCVGNEPKVIIEVLNTNPTDSARFPRPEPWYEVEAKAVLRMLKSNQSHGELECVRPDRVCRNCESKGKRRKTFGQLKLFSGPHKGKTFAEASSNNRYVNYLLGQLVKGQYQELNEQIVDSYRIAFERPKRERMNVSVVFRNGTLTDRSLLLFTEYLVTDPDLYAIEAKRSSKIDVPLDVDPESMAPWDWAEVDRKEIVTAKRERTRYKPGQKRASGVTLARYDFQLGKWTNVTTYPNWLSFTRGQKGLDTNDKKTEVSVS